MMVIGYISGALSVLIIACIVFYKSGYDTGYIQAIKDVREGRKKQEVAP